MDDCLTRQAPGKIGGKGFFAVPEMGGAGGFDLDAVGAIRRGPRAIAAAPFGEPGQRRSIGGGVGRGGGEPGQEGQRIGQWHARSEPGG